MKEKKELQYALGGLLYTPGTKRSIVQKIKEHSIPNLTSLAFCLEDTINDELLKEAETTLGEILCELMKLDDLPFIFIRIRTPEHLQYIANLYKDYQTIITGYILPKFDLSNIDEYILATYFINKEHRTYIMPILETNMVASISTRRQTLLMIKEKLDSIKNWVLNVRVGGNDFCNLYGLRRSSSQTIYDIGVIRDIFVDIINVFSQDYVVSGPVWEYFGASEGLRKELELDRLNGFIGKTAIHPTQLPLIYESMQVEQSDYDDAMRILNWDLSIGVAKSENGKRMNEVKVHGKWAEKIVMLKNIYGIRPKKEGESHDYGY